ncbi:MAG: transglycosylase domain-containing protein [Polyangiaceae bacterium]|nr:transglycosylase domain-containing protein [Polyangiaceae bacterium]
MGWRLLRVAFFSLVILGSLGAVAVILVVQHFSKGLPSVEQLQAGYNPPQVTRVLARDGTLLANLFTERRTVVAFEAVPDHAKLAFLAAEDAGFYEHEGLNYLGMLRALLANLRAGKTRQGGSTITQQVVKNILLDPERSYERKIRETILARRLEHELSKNQIFALYLNHIYLGHGRFGIEEAARYYFGKKAQELTVDQAALLAGIVASPERFSPRQAPEKSLARRRYVLDQMLAKGFITEPLHAQALQAPLRLAPPVEAESEIAPEVVPIVKKLLAELAPEQAKIGGFTVETTIDPVMQSMARQALRENLNAYARRQKLLPPFLAKPRKLWGDAAVGHPKEHHIYVGIVKAVDDAAWTLDVKVGDVMGRVQLKNELRHNPGRLPPSKFAEVGAPLRVGLLAEPEGASPVPLRLELGPESALVAIDPRSHQILALVGSYEAIVGGLDRATQARRQPGSAFKPILYSYALHSRRFTPASILRLPVKGKPGEIREVRFRVGVAQSDNAVAEKVLEECGAENVVQWGAALGIESPLKPTPSLALGAYEVTPLELTNAYTTLASGGEYQPTSLITKITGPGGTVLALPPEPPARRVMPPDEAYLMTSVLVSVVTEGTGKFASYLGRSLAGKTGTTNAAKDAWFVGYSTDLVAGLWVGYDDALPLGPGESGARTAVPGWTSFVKAALSGRPNTTFTRPPKISAVLIDPLTGLLARPGQTDALEEEFLDGTEPEQQAELTGADAGVPTSDAGVESGEPAATNTQLPPNIPEPVVVEPDGGAPIIQSPF